MASPHPPADAAERVRALQEATGGRSAEECARALAAHDWDPNEAAALLLAIPAAPRGSAGADAPTLRSRAGASGSTAAAGAPAAAAEGGKELPVPGRSSPDGAHEVAVNGRDGPASTPAPSHGLGAARGVPGRGPYVPAPGSSPRSLLARLVSLPLWLLRGGVGVLSGAVALSLWAAGGAFSLLITRLASLVHWASGGLLGFAPSARRRPGGPRAVTLPEAALFRQRFEAEYGTVHPEFFPGTFQEAVRRAAEQYRFLLVYLHSPEHVDTPQFCARTLCNAALVEYVDEKFVVWGGDVRGPEGFQMSGRLRASSFPFCALLTSAGPQRIHLLRTVEGPVGPIPLMELLQRVLEDQGALLVAARAEEEERQFNRRLREEQDAEYQAALLADQERERQRQEEDLRRQEEETAQLQAQEEAEQRAAAAAEAAAKVEAAIRRRRQEAAAALGDTPEKGPGVTQVVVRLPGGQRKERRFANDSPVQRLYDFIDAEALGTPELPTRHYLLVSNFPRTVYGKEWRTRTLQDAGLHPQASLFVQPEDEEEHTGSAT